MAIKEIGQGSATSVELDADPGLIKNSDGETVIAVTADEKVGVGTTTPRRVLDVLDASNPALRLTHTDNTHFTEVQITGTGNQITSGSHATNLYDIKRAVTKAYSSYQAGASQEVDGGNKGLLVGTQSSGAAYIWSYGTGSNGTLNIGAGSGANAITIDASNNTTAVNNLSTNGNVTLGDAGTDEHTLNGTLNLNATPADLTCSGTTATFTAGETVNRGDVVYYKPADSRMWKAVATAAATSRAVAIAAADIAGGAAGRFLLKGFIKDTGTFPTFVAGDVIYTDETAGGGPPTKTAPSTSGDFVQVIGWAVDADTVYFNPDSTVIEVA